MEKLFSMGVLWTFLVLSANLEVLSPDKMNWPYGRDGDNSWGYESSKRFDGTGNCWNV